MVKQKHHKHSRKKPKIPLALEVGLITILTALVAGGFLLIYHFAKKQSAPVIAVNQQTLPANSNPTEKPIKLVCDKGTIVNLVAHEDDDLLFINPDTYRAIKDGSCVHTIYLTAGDDGLGKAYWMRRELGPEAAYSFMLGYQGGWDQSLEQLSHDRYVEIYNPHNNPQVSLIFFRLADGNVNGGGFAPNHFESLLKLEKSQIATIHSVDGQSSYTYTQLVRALVKLLAAYQPAEIRTQSTLVDRQNFDHTDHAAVGRLATKARQLYDPTIPIKYYVGYPIYYRPADVAGSDLLAKQNAFFAYSVYDSKVCQSLRTCQKSNSSYYSYLFREYFY